MDDAVFLTARRHRQAAVMGALEALAATAAMADFGPAEIVAARMLALLAGTALELAGAMTGTVLRMLRRALTVVLTLTVVRALMIFLALRPLAGPLFLRSTALLLFTLTLLRLAVFHSGRAGRLHLCHGGRGGDKTNPGKRDRSGADNRNKAFHIRFRSIVTAHFAAV